MPERLGCRTFEEEVSEILHMMSAGVARRIFRCFILHRLEDKRRLWLW